jgi:methionyl-tRNA formyltransferase
MQFLSSPWRIRCTLPFIREIIDQRKQDIVGLAVAHGDRMTIGKNRSQIVYLFSLLLIMGIPAFIRYATVTIVFKVQKKLAKVFPFVSSPSVLDYAKKNGIEVFDIVTPNSKSFQEKLKALKPDVIINQSQSIIKKDLNIPDWRLTGTMLLPKTGVGLWVLYRGEGPGYPHFVEEGIDSGAIIVQERYAVHPSDTFNSLVKKNYEIAPKAMLKALTLMEAGNPVLLKNDDASATYNSVPTFKDAFHYRWNRLMGKR